MLEQLPLAGKSVLVVEDEPLIALNVETLLAEAGVSTVKIANSVAKARSALKEGTPFDAAIVDLRVADGDASPLIGILSERAIPVVVTTGTICGQQTPDFSKAVAVLQKPYPDNDLIKVMTWLTKTIG
jgi:DNA-binding NtrC family response regulator